jgi:hypothetical protein
MKYLALGLAVVAGIVLLIFSDNVFNLTGSRRSDGDGPELGRIEDIQGEVRTRLPHQVNFISAKSSQSIYHQQALMTGPDGTAAIKLQSGARVKVEENSSIITEFDMNEPAAINITILAGMAQVLDPGQPELLRIFRDGKRLLTGTQAPVPVKIKPGASGATSPEESMIIATTRDESAASQNSADGSEKSQIQPETSAQQETLSTDEISNEVSKQKSFISRCYLSYLSRVQNTARTGTILMGFTIQPSGSVSDTKVISSDLRDDVLQKCLVEVIERTRFKPFRSIPIQMEYPIQLE